jgi:hypothetical protein
VSISLPRVLKGAKILIHAWNRGLSPLRHAPHAGRAVEAPSASTIQPAATVSAMSRTTALPAFAAKE